MIPEEPTFTSRNFKRADSYSQTLTRWDTQSTRFHHYCHGFFTIWQYFVIEFSWFQFFLIYQYCSSDIHRKIMKESVIKLNKNYIYVLSENTSIPINLRVQSYQSDSIAFQLDSCNLLKCTFYLIWPQKCWKYYLYIMTAERLQEKYCFCVGFSFLFQKPVCHAFCASERMPLRLSFTPHILRDCDAEETRRGSYQLSWPQTAKWQFDSISGTLSWKIP